MPCSRSRRKIQDGLPAVWPPGCCVLRPCARGRRAAVLLADDHEDRAADLLQARRGVDPGQRGAAARVARGRRGDDVRLRVGGPHGAGALCRTHSPAGGAARRLRSRLRAGARPQPIGHLLLHQRLLLIQILIQANNHLQN